MNPVTLDELKQDGQLIVQQTIADGTKLTVYFLPRTGRRYVAANDMLSTREAVEETISRYLESIAKMNQIIRTLPASDLYE